MKQREHAIIEAIDLTKEYPVGRSRKAAIAGVSLSVPAGEVWTVCGPSGSGKTTLLGLLGGMIVPTRGEVRLRGRPVSHLRDHHRAAVRRGLVGMVFQDFALVSGMSVLENVLLPCVPLGGAGAGHEAKARDLLARFGIEALASLRVERLSGGERQRAAIVRALILDPPVLFLDEPTAHVDAAGVASLVELLVELRGDGKTIVVASHDARLARREQVDGTLELADGVIKV